MVVVCVVGGQSLPTFDRRRVDGSHRLVPGASFVITIVIIRPVVVHLLSLREELLKDCSSFGHLLPLFALPLFAHEKPAPPAWAQFSNDLGELGGVGGVAQSWMGGCWARSCFVLKVDESVADS